MKKLPCIMAIGLALAFVSSVASAVTYEVGDGKPYTSIGAVPWESLAAGDTVNIHYRATPYAEKWCFCPVGTVSQPVLIHGVPGPGGELPVVDGQNATTRLELSYWNDERCVIKVGGGTIPPDTVAKYITIENLHIRNGLSGYTYTCDEGTTKTYVSSASSIYVCFGENITVRNCILDNCSNGFFVASSDSPASKNILIEGNYIYDNGNSGSLYEHNAYVAAIGMTVQYNRFDPLRAGCSGNNFKDRSANLVVRYNWLKDGNRELDLVEGQDSVLIRNDPLYHKAWVYGNILIENMSGNRQMVHFGGDSGSSSTYRNGPLFFYNNSLVSNRTDRNTIFRISGPSGVCDFRNTIYETYTTSLNEINSTDCPNATINMSHCWLNTGWIAGGGILNNDGTSITGGAPGFVDQAGEDYHLAAGSACINAGGPLHADCGSYPVDRQYVKHQASEARPGDGTIDIGAYEYIGGGADLVITTTSLPGGQVGVGYSQTLQATGGVTPYTWSVLSGSLPSGLSLGSSTGTVSGTPSASGTSNFTVRVTDSQGTPDTDDQALSITVNPAADLVITTTSLPDGAVDLAYSQTLAATGGLPPYTWSTVSGSLPSGLSLNSSSGVISGTPTATGTSNFTVRVTDSQGVPDTDDQALSIAIQSAPMYQFTASDTEASTTSTSYVTKATLTFNVVAAEDWVMLGFAEYKGSSASYSTLVRMQVDGADQAALTVEPKDPTDYQTFSTVKAANLSVGSHTIKIDYASENSGATAYIRNARVVAIRKGALEIASNAAEGTVALTTTLTNYVSVNFTPATAGDYLLIAGAEASGRTGYSTQIQATLGGAVLDDSLFEAKDAADFCTFTSFSVVNCPASVQTLAVTAAKETGAPSTHNIRRARVVAIRLSGSRFTGYQFASSDTESTTTSTAFQQKLTKSWSVTTAGNWLLLSSFRFGGSSESNSTEGRVQVNDTTTSAQPFREPKDATDYMNGASVDVRNLAVGSRFMDIDYRSENASATAKIMYAHLVALPL